MPQVVSRFILEFDEQGICTKAGIGLTNVNPTPLRAVRSEAALVGTSLDDDAIASAAQYASEDCNPSSDLRGDIDYKRHIIRAVTKKMINKAKQRAFKN